MTETTVFNDEHHILKSTAMSLKEGNKSIGSIVWGVRKGYPRITQYINTATGIPLVYIAPMNPILVEHVLLTMIDVFKGPKDTVRKIECYNVAYIDNAKSDDVELQSTIIVEKAADGINYIYIVVKDKQVIKFKLFPDLKWHKFLDKNNKEITDKEMLSSLYARGYIHRVQSAMDACLNKHIKTVIPKMLNERTPKPAGMSTEALTKALVNFVNGVND